MRFAHRAAGSREELDHGVSTLRVAYHAIVVGLGAFGSAATYQLAKAGVSVLGIDRFHPPHSLGSSHGETRITRMAVGEGVEFSALALRRRHHRQR